MVKFILEKPPIQQEEQVNLPLLGLLRTLKTWALK